MDVSIEKREENRNFVCQDHYCILQVPFVSFIFFIFGKKKKDK